MKETENRKLTPFEDEDGYWGFTNESGEVIIPPQYEEVGDFKEGMAWVCDERGYGYINEEGELAIPVKYSYASDFENGTAIVEEGFKGLSYFIDKTGKKIGKGHYFDISPDFIDDITVGTLLSGKQILLNRKGLPVSNSYDMIESTEDEEHWYFEEKEIGGIMNSRGEVIIYPGDFDFKCAYFSDGLMLVKKDGLYGYVNEEGKLAIPFKYEEAGDFYDGRAIVKYKGKAGYINPQGDPIGELRYDEAYKFREKRGIVKKEEKWGFVDENGTEVIAPVYDLAYLFHEGLAAVMKGNKWGFIDSDGNEIIPFEYDFVWDFTNGKAEVTKDKRSFYIDKSGKEIK